MLYNLFYLNFLLVSSSFGSYRVNFKNVIRP
jgi:hypothetical protein